MCDLRVPTTQSLELTELLSSGFSWRCRCGTSDAKLRAEARKLQFCAAEKKKLLLVLSLPALQYHEYVLYPYPPLFSCPSTPQVADERDCSVFYECNRDMFGGAKLVRKSCGIGLMFNNVVGVCDWPFRVRNIRPECR